MITVEHLTKRYGDFTAVDDLSFTIEPGHVYGFLGPNGAGKSTTMNIITGCLSPTEGTVTIGGHDIMEEPQEAKRLIGYLPEQPPLYLGETPLEYLRFVAEAKGLRGDAMWEQIEQAVYQTGIERVRNQIIGTLSKGYKQRVGIAQALIGGPEVIILDEPTVGLDPIQIIEIRDLIRELGREHTVIFSSHILSEVQAICEKVLIISSGRLVAFDTPDRLQKKTAQGCNVSFSVQGGSDAVHKVLDDAGFAGQYSVSGQEGGTVSVQLHAGAEDEQELCRRLFFAFAEAKLPIFSMTSQRANLEDIFLQLTDKGESGGAPAAASAEDGEEAQA